MDYQQFITDNHIWIIMIINGLIAGWLAGLLLGGGGLIRNLIVGLIGAVVGGYLVNAGLLKLPYDFDALPSVRQPDRGFDRRCASRRHHCALSRRPLSFSSGTERTASTVELRGCRAAPFAVSRPGRYTPSPGEISLGGGMDLARTMPIRIVADQAAPW